MTSSLHAGGCLCGALRYETLTDPAQVTICHCRFCQRATGAAYMVEPIFKLDALRLTRGEPAIYAQPSGGSGRTVRAHFCPACGTKLFLSFDRFPDVCGVYAGTFDDPGWFDMTPETTKQIFIDQARPDTVLMPGIRVFGQHAVLNDGTPLAPVTYAQPQVVGRRSGA